MTGPAPSALRRDLELIDAAMLDVTRRLLAGEAPDDPLENMQCRVVAERLAELAETLPAILAPEHRPHRCAVEHREIAA